MPIQCADYIIQGAIRDKGRQKNHETALRELQPVKMQLNTSKA